MGQQAHGTPARDNHLAPGTAPPRCTGADPANPLFQRARNAESRKVAQFKSILTACILRFVPPLISYVTEASSLTCMLAFIS
jgi:hypothetical protein